MRNRYQEQNNRKAQLRLFCSSYINVTNNGIMNIKIINQENKCLL
jgi:hypothetical protein